MEDSSKRGGWSYNGDSRIGRYVGRGLGTAILLGKVVTFDESTNIFTVSYENGDSEGIDGAELGKILVTDERAANRGLLPRKRNLDLQIDSEECKRSPEKFAGIHEMEETKDFTSHASVNPSQLLSVGYAGAHSDSYNTMLHGTHKFIQGSQNHMLQTASHFPGYISAVSSLRQSQFSETQTEVASMKSSATLIDKTSPLVASSHAETSHLRLDACFNAPSHVMHVPAATSADYLPNAESSTLQPTPYDVTYLGEANNLAQLKPEAAYAVKVAQTSQQVIGNQQALASEIQAAPAMIIGHQPPRGLTFVHGPSFFTDHNDIAKRVQKILQPTVFDHPDWIPPSSDYTNKQIKCQICKITIMDVESLLVCDGCEKGAHLKCLQSYNNKGIPKAKWHCSRCLRLSNGKPLPPKYGHVTRSVRSSEASSNTVAHSSSEKRAENSDSKVRQQKIITYRNSYLSHPIHAGSSQIDSTPDSRASGAGGKQDMHIDIHANLFSVASTSADYLPNPESSTLQSTPSSVTNLGKANKLAQLKSESAYAIKVAETSQQVIGNKQALASEIQAAPAMIIGCQPPHGLAFVRGPSFFTDHNDIAKRVQKILQPMVFDQPNWIPPSSDYTNKQIKCQICKITIMDVESLLVCDGCGKGGHLKCLQSYNNKGIPKAEWHCSRCLRLTNGKPLPPKYGLVTRSVLSLNTVSHSSSEKRAENSDSKVRQQKIITNENSDLSHTIHASTPGSRQIDSTPDSKASGGGGKQSFRCPAVGMENQNEMHTVTASHSNEMQRVMAVDRRIKNECSDIEMKNNGSSHMDISSPELSSSHQKIKSEHTFENRHGSVAETTSESQLFSELKCYRDTKVAICEEASASLLHKVC